MKFLNLNDDINRFVNGDCINYSVFEADKLKFGVNLNIPRRCHLLHFKMKKCTVD